MNAYDETFYIQASATALLKEFTQRHVKLLLFFCRSQVFFPKI